MLGGWGCSKMVMEWSPVLGTVQEFIDYSLFIAGILAIYYFIKFWTIGGKSKEDTEKDSEAFRKWVKDKWDANKAAKKTREEKEKKEKEKSHRDKRVRMVLSGITEAYTISSDLRDCLKKVEKSTDKTKRDVAIIEANGFIKEIHDHLQTANHILRREAHHSTGGEHKFFDGLYSESGTIISMVEGIKHSLPSSASATWGAEIKAITDNIIGSPGVKTNCDDLITKLNDYIKEGKI